MPNFIKTEIENKPQKIGDLFKVVLPFNRIITRKRGVDLIQQNGNCLTFQLKQPAAYLEVYGFSLFPTREEFSIIPLESDFDSDGYPDEAELYGEDTVNFRNWFVWIAMDQSIKLSPSWAVRDCSGLIRFSLKEALKKHDAKWFAETGISDVSFSDIMAFNYPEIPTIKEEIYRLKAGH